MTLLFIIAILAGVISSILYKSTKNIELPIGMKTLVILFIITSILPIVIQFYPNQYWIYISISLLVSIVLFIGKIIIAGIGLFILTIGGLLNVIVMYANGGKMPVVIDYVLSSARITNLVNSRDPRHVLATSETAFKYLCDFIPIPQLNFSDFDILSIGDIFMALGLLIFVFNISIIVKHRCVEKKHAAGEESLCI